MVWVNVILSCNPCCTEDAVHGIAPSELCLVLKSGLDPGVLDNWFVVAQVFNEVGSDGVLNPMGCLVFAAGMFQWYKFSV